MTLGGEVRPRAALTIISAILAIAVFGVTAWLGFAQHSQGVRIGTSERTIAKIEHTQRTAKAALKVARRNTRRIQRLLHLNRRSRPVTPVKRHASAPAAGDASGQARADGSPSTSTGSAAPGHSPGTGATPRPTARPRPSAAPTPAADETDPAASTPAPVATSVIGVQAPAVPVRVCTDLVRVNC
jgi:hypothetical protein